MSHGPAETYAETMPLISSNPVCDVLIGIFLFFLNLNPMSLSLFL